MKGQDVIYTPPLAHAGAFSQRRVMSLLFQPFFFSFEYGGLYLVGVQMKSINCGTSVRLYCLHRGTARVVGYFCFYTCCWTAVGRVVCDVSSVPIGVKLVESHNLCPSLTGIVRVVAQEHVT